VDCHKEGWRSGLRRVPQRLDLRSQCYSGGASCPAACRGGMLHLAPLCLQVLHAAVETKLHAQFFAGPQKGIPYGPCGTRHGENMKPIRAVGGHPQLFEKETKPVSVHGVERGRHKTAFDAESPDEIFHAEGVREITMSASGRQQFAPRFRALFENDHPCPRPGGDNGRHQSGRPGADDSQVGTVWITIRHGTITQSVLKSMDTVMVCPGTRNHSIGCRGGLPLAGERVLCTASRGRNGQARQRQAGLLAFEYEDQAADLVIQSVTRGRQLGRGRKPGGILQE